MAMHKVKRFKSYCEGIAQHLECSVCLEFAKAPVRQCINSHICCCSCEHLNICPICRYPFAYRNAIISKIVNTFINRCLFKKYGCSKVLRPLEYDYHIESCSYRRIQCKICFQQVFAYRFRNHILAKHPESSWMTDSNKLYWKNFDFNKNSHKIEIVQAFDQLFWYCFSYNTLEHSINIAVQFIGPKRQAPTYFYEIDSGPSNNGNRIIFKRSTHYYMDAAAYIFRMDGFSIKKKTMIALSKGNIFVLRLNIFQEKGDFQRDRYTNNFRTVIFPGN